MTQKRPPAQPYFIDFVDVGKIVEIPNGYLPERATIAYGQAEVHVDLVLRLDHGEPVFEAVTVIPAGGSSHLSSLLEVRWDEIEERIIAWAGWAAATRVRHQSDNPPGPFERTLSIEAEVDAKAAALGQLRRRRMVTPDLLRQVAEIATADPRKRTQRVSEHFHTSHRNATRWISEARSRGFITEEES